MWPRKACAQYAIHHMNRETDGLELGTGRWAGKPETYGQDARFEDAFRVRQVKPRR